MLRLLLINLLAMPSLVFSISSETTRCDNSVIAGNLYEVTIVSTKSAILNFSDYNWTGDYTIEILASFEKNGKLKKKNIIHMHTNENLQYDSNKNFNLSDIDTNFSGGCIASANPQTGLTDCTHLKARTVTRLPDSMKVKPGMSENTYWNSKSPKACYVTFGLKLEYSWLYNGVLTTSNRDFVADGFLSKVNTIDKANDFVLHGVLRTSASRPTPATAYFKLIR